MVTGTNGKRGQVEKSTIYTEAGPLTIAEGLMTSAELFYGKKGDRYIQMRIDGTPWYINDRDYVDWIDKVIAPAGDNTREAARLLTAAFDDNPPMVVVETRRWTGDDGTFRYQKNVKPQLARLHVEARPRTESEPVTETEPTA